MIIWLRRRNANICLWWHNDDLSTTTQWSICPWQRKDNDEWMHWKTSSRGTLPLCFVFCIARPGASHSHAWICTPGPERYATSRLEFSFCFFISILSRGSGLIMFLDCALCMAASCWADTSSRSFCIRACLQNEGKAKNLKLVSWVRFIIFCQNWSQPAQHWHCFSVKLNLYLRPE